jgi:hypothetical protein
MAAGTRNQAMAANSRKKGCVRWMAVITEPPGSPAIHPAARPPLPSTQAATISAMGARRTSRRTNSTSSAIGT